MTCRLQPQHQQSWGLKKLRGQEVAVLQQTAANFSDSKISSKSFTDFHFEFSHRTRGKIN